MDGDGGELAGSRPRPPGQPPAGLQPGHSATPRDRTRTEAEWPASLSGTAPPLGRRPGLLPQPPKHPPASLTRSHQGLAQTSVVQSPALGTTPVLNHPSSKARRSPLLLKSLPGSSSLLPVAPRFCCSPFPASFRPPRRSHFWESCVPFLVPRTQLPCLLQEALPDSQSKAGVSPGSSRPVLLTPQA